MAEYINREDLKFLEIPIAPVLQGEQVHYEQGILKEWLESVPTADVIELKPILEEYEELVQTNPTSQQVDEFCIRTMRKILCDYYVEKL